MVAFSTIDSTVGGLGLPLVSTWPLTKRARGLLLIPNFELALVVVPCFDVTAFRPASPAFVNSLARHGQNKPVNRRGAAGMTTPPPSQRRIACKAAQTMRQDCSVSI